jgi:hypothetical protein
MPQPDGAAQPSPRTAGWSSQQPLPPHLQLFHLQRPQHVLRLWWWRLPAGVQYRALLLLLPLPLSLHQQALWLLLLPVAALLLLLRLGCCLLQYRLEAGLLKLLLPLLQQLLLLGLLGDWLRLAAAACAAAAVLATPRQVAIEQAHAAPDVCHPVQQRAAAAAVQGCRRLPHSPDAAVHSFATAAVAAAAATAGAGVPPVGAVAPRHGVTGCAQAQDAC